MYFNLNHLILCPKALLNHTLENIALVRLLVLIILHITIIVQLSVINEIIERLSLQPDD